MTPGTPDPKDALVRSYLFLRRAIGILGTALPMVVIVGKQLIDGGGLLTSISGYYYTSMRDVFVGAMCASGVFLLSYRGYDRVDNITGNVAAAAAIGLALLPTTPETGATGADKLIGAIHIGFAAIFFLSLAFFCLVQFPKTDRATPERRKLARNRVYLTSGWIILACLALILVFAWLLDDQTRSIRPALWLESIASVAYGVAWLIKGDTLLRDLTPRLDRELPAAA